MSYAPFCSKNSIRLFFPQIHPLYNFYLLLSVNQVRKRYHFWHSYWFRLQQNDKWYLITPLTVTQREDYSDIEKRPTNYTRAMTDLTKEWLVSQKQQNIKMNYTQNKPPISLNKINFST